MVHLLVANEQCHAIFLAAVTDHGFARLLEQYACIPAAKRKIILVDPGFISYEIAGLQYQSVTWPTVFKHKYVDPASKAKGLTIQKKKRTDSTILYRVAARELILRVTYGIRSADSQTIIMGRAQANKFAASNFERYRRGMRGQQI